MNGEQLLA